MRAGASGAALALLLSLAGCQQGTDVVARAADAGIDAAGVDAGGSSPANIACGPAADSYTLLAKSGDVHRVDLATNKVIASSQPSCIPPGIGPAALDRASNVWVAGGGVLAKLDPTLASCTKNPLSVSPTAMAFVWDPKTDRETLYTLIDGVLTILDTTTLATTPIGKLAIADVRGLAGTVDGWLLAFAGDPVIVIGYVSVADAQVKIGWQTKSPDPAGSPFVGGIPTTSGFDLVFGPVEYGFDLASQEIAVGIPLFDSDPGIVGVASSPCSTFGK